MWRFDLRLRGMTELVNEVTFEKYEQAVSNHPYIHIPEIIRWIIKKLDVKLLGVKSAPDLTVIAGILAEGDRHYAEIFSSQDLLPKDRDGSLPVEPLSDSVDRIIVAITGKRLRNEENATIYGYLEEALWTSLAELLALDARYNGYEKWQALVTLFYQSRTFYGALTSHIPIATTKEHEEELCAPYDPDNVVRYISQGDKRMEADAYQRQYLKKMDKYREAAPAVYVHNLTENSATMSLGDTEVFKKDLISRLGREPEVKWIDGLRWPLAQAAALNEYQDLAEIAALVTELVAQRERLQSSFVHLLLIMLEQHFDLMRRISFNLRNFETPLGSYYFDPAIAATLHAAGQSRLENWKENDIKNEIALIFAPISTISDPTDDLHRGLFGWVANQDRERWLNNPNANLILQMIDQLHEEYLEIYGPGKWAKTDLLKIIEPEGLDWKRFKILYSLWLADETDEGMRQGLKDQMGEYILSNDFFWNSSYHFDNDHFGQALHVTDLYFGIPDGAAELVTLTTKTRNWHEGWAYSGAGGIKEANRHIFLLTCGICLAYLHYDAGNAIPATKIWQATSQQIVEQYRATGSELDRNHYLLPLRMLVHTLLKFDEPALADCLKELFNKIDHIEDRIVLAHSMMESTGFLKKMISAGIRHEIWQHIGDQYWVMELRIRYAKLPELIRQYENLYKAAEPWFLAH